MSKTKLESLLMPNLDLSEKIVNLEENCSNLRVNCVNGFRVRKIVKQIKFEEVWGKFETRNRFQRQRFRKNLRQTLDLL